MHERLIGRRELLGAAALALAPLHIRIQPALPVRLPNPSGIHQNAAEVRPGPPDLRPGPAPARIEPFAPAHVRARLRDLDAQDPAWRAFMQLWESLGYRRHDASAVGGAHRIDGRPPGRAVTVVLLPLTLRAVPGHLTVFRVNATVGRTAYADLSAWAFQVDKQGRRRASRFRSRAAGVEEECREDPDELLRRVRRQFLWSMIRCCAEETVEATLEQMLDKAHGQPGEHPEDAWVWLGAKCAAWCPVSVGLDLAFS
ncbi:MAG: hypothetical protein HY355_06140 [Armatimonadetes bacterium]|nr:hypothetical protein [Armatimonadota bacterium]